MGDLQEIKMSSTLILNRLKTGPFLLFMILVFPVLVDLLNGFLTYGWGLDFSIGVLYRGLIFFAAIPFLVVNKNKSWNIYITIICGVWLLGCLVWAISGYFAPVKELMFFVKMIYPLMLVPLIFYIINKYKIQLEQLVLFPVTYCFLAAASIVFSLITGMGIEYTASKYSFGAKSFFVAQNDIGLSMLIGFTMSLYLFFKSFSIRYFFMSAVIMAGLLGLSTRTGILGAIGVFGFLMVAIMFYGKKSVQISHLYKGIIFLFFSVAAVFSVIKIIEFISEYNYMIKKFETLAYEQPRQILFEAGTNRINNRHWIYNLFGEGTVHFREEVGNNLIGMRTVSDDGQPVEIDYLDLIGNYGLILSVFVLLFPVYLFFKISASFFIKREFSDLIFLICISLFLIHSFLAGHAMISPLVSTVMVVVYVYIFHKKTLTTSQAEVLVE